VLEGIVFNHRTHVEALAEGFAIREARLTGGVTRNPVLAQMFADVLKLPVTVAATDEAAAFGAALCAGAAVGMFPSAHRPSGAAVRQYVPDAARGAVFDERFSLYSRLAESLAPYWPEIDRLGRRSLDDGADA